MRFFIGLSGGILAIGLLSVVVRFQDKKVLAKGNIIIYFYCILTILSAFFLAEHSAYIVFVSLFLIVRSTIFFAKGKVNKLTYVIYLILFSSNTILPFMLI